MKKIIPGLFLFLTTAFANAQGLENIIVETYYVSDVNDTSVNADGGVLLVGVVDDGQCIGMQHDFPFLAHAPCEPTAS